MEGKFAVPLAAVGKEISEDVNETGIIESKIHALDLEDHRVIKEVLEIDFGEIEDPKYGKASLKATIPLLSKLIEPNLEKLDAVKQHFADYLYERGVIWSKKELKCIEWAIIATAYIAPNHELDSPTGLAMAAVGLTMFCMDDLMDEGFVSENVESSARLEEILEKLFRDIGDCDDANMRMSIAESVPALQPVVYLMKYTAQLLKSVKPDYDFKASCTGKCIKDAALCQFILRSPNIRTHLSIDGFKRLRRYDICIEGPVEFLNVISGVTLKPKIRDSILYKIVMELYSNMHGYLNDFSGILRDLESTDIYLNSVILLSMPGREMSLETEFLKHNQIMNDQVNDFVILSNKLLLDNPEDEDLEAYLNIARNSWTQTVFTYTGLPDRYKLGSATYVTRPAY